MKALLIGGTGTISADIARQLLDKGCDLYLLNRGNRSDSALAGANVLTADIHDEKAVADLISDMQFDVVADFIAYETHHVERDYRLFQGRTKQFIFISSASAYQTPTSDYRITEGTPLSNPYWQYSRNKIACEDYLMKQYREHGFPITIVRPSHTYDDRSIPLGVHGRHGSWQVAKRMLQGKSVIIHGDGTSLWTMTHSSDVAKGFIGLMGNIHAIGESVHITSDETVTWNQIYEVIADALGVTLRAVHVASDFLASCCPWDLGSGLLGDKANSVVFDNAKIKRLVPDFVASTRLDQGIKKTVANILGNPQYQIEDSEFDAWCDQVIQSLDDAGLSLRRNLPE